MSKYAHPVTISEITENGFRLQVLNREYYLGRLRYPYFSDATEEEIRDVSFLGDEKKGCFYWNVLELRFDLWQLDNPDESYLLGQFVRGVPRPDLFVNHSIPLLEDKDEKEYDGKTIPKSSQESKRKQKRGRTYQQPDSQEET